MEASCSNFDRDYTKNNDDRDHNSYKNAMLYQLHGQNLFYGDKYLKNGKPSVERKKKKMNYYICNNNSLYYYDNSNNNYAGYRDSNVPYTANTDHYGNKNLLYLSEIDKQYHREKYSTENNFKPLLNVAPNPYPNVFCNNPPVPNQIPTNIYQNSPYFLNNNEDIKDNMLQNFNRNREIDMKVPQNIYENQNAYNFYEEERICPVAAPKPNRKRKAASTRIENPLPILTADDVLNTLAETCSVCDRERYYYR